MAKSRATLQRRLTELGEHAIQGTLVEVFVRCGTSSCGCHSDRERRHGPHAYLKFRNPEGRQSALYVPREQVEQVRRAVAAWSDLWETIVEISHLNRQVLGKQLRRRKGAASRG